MAMDKDDAVRILKEVTKEVENGDWEVMGDLAWDRDADEVPSSNPKRVEREITVHRIDKEKRLREEKEG